MRSARSTSTTRRGTCRALSVAVVASAFSLVVVGCGSASRSAGSNLETAAPPRPGPARGPVAASDPASHQPAGAPPVVFNGARYTIAVPADWTHSSQPTFEQFSRGEDSLTVEIRDCDIVPTVESVTMTELAVIATPASRFTRHDVRRVVLRGGPTIVARYEIDARPDDFTRAVHRLDVERYAFWHDGHEAIVTLASPAGTVDPHRRRHIANSFTWTP